MKRKDLNNIILEAYQEVLTELNEAPGNVHYIKVERTELMEALGLLEKAFAGSNVKFELNDPDTIYIHRADNADMHDAVEELKQNGIIVDETSIDDELEEGTGKVKKGTWAGRPVIVYMDGPDHEWKVKFTKTGKVLDYVELMANLKFDDGTDYRDYLNESMLDEIEDEEEPTPEEEPDTTAPEETVLEDATDAILGKFPTVKAAIIKLQTDDFKEFVDSIDWISPRPTSFRVNLKNGQDYILKWTGKTFEAQIMGKRYLLSNIADYQQALDKLAILYREAPMKGAGEEPEDASDFGSADTGRGDFPGGEGGAESGEGGGEDIPDTPDEESADLSDEPVDFEDGAEPDA